MIICSHCHHQNIDDASQCEACLSELESESSCPNCGHNHLRSARFCGNCGYSFEPPTSINMEDKVADVSVLNIPEPLPPEPLIDLSPVRPIRTVTALQSPVIDHIPIDVVPHGGLAQNIESFAKFSSTPKSKKAVLIHQSTQFRIDLSQFQFPVHLGKPNRKIMPDIDLSTFQHSAIVSRIHADIDAQDNQFFIRDNESANGTFVNNQRLQPRQIQRLESGDKISLGKGDLVTFTFELS